MTILLSNIDRNHFTNRETNSPYWADYYNHVVNPYMEVVNNNKNLVICYGDSWTWGDSLGNASARDKIEDTEFRVQNVYGRHLANYLNADFVNFAIPGICNFWIHNQLTILCNHDLPRLTAQYNNIYIVITLTEVGREFDFDLYKNEFQEFYDWTQDANRSGDKILKQAEKFDFIKLANIESALPQNCKLIVGRNFTNTHIENQHIVKNLIYKPWADLLLEKQNLEPVAGVSIMSFGADRFNKFITDQKLNDQAYKEWFVNDLSAKAKQQIDLLNKSMYNYKKASKHPTPEGHILWAEYLFNYINKMDLK